MGRRTRCSFFFYRDLSARCCESGCGGFNFCGVFSVYRPLFVFWLSVLCVDIAEEVISCWSLRDPKCVVCSGDPPEFYPAAPFSVEGDRVEALRGGHFCIVSNCFFGWYSVIRNHSPLYPSIYVSFRGSDPPLVKSVWLEVPTVLCPLCQGIRFEDLGLNVTLKRSVTRLGQYGAMR